MEKSVEKKIKKFLKKIISISLCLSLVFNYLFFTFADENEINIQSEFKTLEITKDNINIESTFENVEENVNNETIIEDILKEFEEGYEKEFEDNIQNQIDKGNLEEDFVDEVVLSEEDIQNGNRTFDEEFEEEMEEEPEEDSIEDVQNENVDEVDEKIENKIEEKIVEYIQNENTDEINEKLGNEIEEKIVEDIQNENIDEINKKLEAEIEEDIIDEATPSEVSEEIEEFSEEKNVDEIPLENENNNIKNATFSEVDEALNEKCEIIVYYITDMKLKNKGNGGSYNYSWDTFLIDKNKEFSINEKIPKIIKHSSCEQEYALIGFTTVNQVDSLWKGADFAGGKVTLEKNFIVNNNMEIYAVYEAKDTYISSIVIGNEITYKTTTIPNKAIKNIYVSNNNDDIYVKNENVKYYKIKNNLNDINYMFTKDSSEGIPIKVEGFSLEKYDCGKLIKV